MVVGFIVVSDSVIQSLISNLRIFALLSYDKCLHACDDFFIFVIFVVPFYVDMHVTGLW